MVRLNENSSNNYFLMMVVIAFVLLLGACAEAGAQKPKVPAKTEKTKGQHTGNLEEWKLPITVPEGEFYKSAGWLSDNEILYITNLEQTSSLYRYHLVTGKSEIIYKSHAPIVNAQVSPSKKNILIHSSPSSYEGIVTIIDPVGTEQVSQSLASYELLFEWNPYNETEVLISKFNEDWSFEVWLLDIEKAAISELPLRQPFIKWTGEQKLAFINWDDNHPALFAPLLEVDLSQLEERTLSPDIFQFSTYQNLLLTISATGTDNAQAIYSFFDQEMKEIFTFPSLLLSKYSDWLIPFYDYCVAKKQFAVLKPIKSGEVDSYMEGFDLEIYDLDKRGSQLIMSGLENEPIQFSPSGKALLYGNRFEKIIDLTKKHIVVLTKE